MKRIISIKRNFNYLPIITVSNRLSYEHLNFKIGLSTIVFLMLSFFITNNVFGQRQSEYLDRGLVAVKAEDHVFISWRMFVGDNENTEFNLYRNGNLVNSSPVKGKTNFVDSLGTVKDIYYVEVSDEGGNEFSQPVSVWEQQYKTIPLQTTGRYYPNDCSVGDVDGDGEMEIIVKIQADNPDNTHEVDTEPVMLNAYKLDGTMLWSINLGENIRAGAHYTQFMVYDLDGDGISEIACKTAPGTKDGTGNFLSKGPAATDDDSEIYVDYNGRILKGPEYLSVFDGINGEEVSTVKYNPGRHPNTDNPSGSQLNSIWGDDYGNRVDRFLACVAYFGDKPSLVMCRGYYTRTVLVAYDLQNGELVQRWVFDTRENFKNYSGQGNHNLSVADVDQDGKDEIVYGAMCVDDDGTGLWTTGLGHGDAMHVSDIDPSRPGLEKWGITEPGSTSGSQLLDAKTGEIIWGTPNGDIGRGVSADISADFPGMECWGGTNGLRSCKDEYVGGGPSSSNFLAWWDGDLLRELLDGVTVSKYNANGNDEVLLTAFGCMSNNGTKSTPNFSGDILGDWREEVILRTEDNKSLRIYTTTIPTEYGIYTLLQDPQYRLALAWQNVAYNQPPHPGFFLGHGMDLASIPQPDLNIIKSEETSSLHINEPTNGFELGLGLDLNIVLRANGLSESNQNIVIFDGESPIDTVTEPPYYIKIEGLTTGSHIISAQAYDTKGSIIESNSVTIEVDQGFPKVSIESPEQGASVLPEGSITLSASAFDTDGSVDSVEFYLNDELISTFNEEPYSKEVQISEPGVYEFKAIAYDDAQNSGESELVSFVAGAPTGFEESELGYCGFDNGSGSIDSNHSGFTGSGFANTENVRGVAIEWLIEFPDSAIYRFEWGYASTSSRPGRLNINDEFISDVIFEPTADWNVWGTSSVDAVVNKGIMKVSLEALGESGLGNIDFLRIYSIGTSEATIGIDCDSYIFPDDATLSSLSIEGVDLSPSFRSDRNRYSVELGPGTTSINIEAIPNDPDALVEGDGVLTISEASGSVDIVVTSRDNTNSETYTINYDFSTGINDFYVGKPEIFPIPAQDYINVSLKDISENINSISIYSVDGSKVMSKNNINRNEIRIEFPEIKSGLYLIDVKSQNRNYRSIFNVVRK